MPNAITARTRADLHPPPGLPLRRSRHWQVVLIVYVVLYATLLFRTDGYPYVLDNNESYSSLWHARSLYENGVAKTKGLTDEVFSTSPAASPYVHTHQGNFPRLYTFALYAMGFHGIASQIWITTFTVGLAGIWLGFRFLSRLGNPLFATLACLVMMTNYLLFAQWQVSLYNVWHVFFFFSSLSCVCALGDSPHPRRWAWLTLLNFAAFFYWEYVFTAFVVGLCALYATVLYWRRPRVLVLGGLLIGAGAAIAGGVLLAQLTAYMGWDAVMEDIRLTLTARNVSADPALLQRVATFYREHGVIFWHNFMDAAPLRTFGAFWDSITGQHLKFYSPAIAGLMLIVTLGWLTGAYDRRGIVPAGRSGASAALKWLAVALPLGWALLPFTVGRESAAHATFVSWSAAAGLAVVLGRFWFGTWWGWARLGWRRVSAAAVFCGAAGWVLFNRDRLFDPAFQADLGAAIGWESWRTVTPALAGLSLVLGLTLAVLGNTRVLGFARRRLTGVPVFLLCCLIAYGAAYRVFTGYIYSGYLNRQVPLLVFVTDLLLALALYVGVTPLLRMWRLRQSGGRPGPRVSAGGLAALGGIVTILVVTQWTRLQAAYLTVAPPDTYAFLSVLDRPEFKSRSLVSNTYPAPMAARTNSWGYADTSIFSGTLALTPRGYMVERELKYLWLADGPSNPAYLKPDLAIKVVETPNIAVALQLRQERAAAEPGATPLPETVGLVQGARPLQGAFLQHRKVYSDGRRVAIVELDWDFPPYLQPGEHFRARLSGATLRQKLALTGIADAARRRWRITVTPVADAAAGQGEVRLRLAEIDDRTVFSEQNLRAAGWRVQDGTPEQPEEWVWQKTDGAVTPLSAYVVGDQLSLEFARGPAAGVVHVQINDHGDNVNLRAPEIGTEGFSFSSAYPYGRFVSIPVFAEGLYLHTALWNRGGRKFVELQYHFAQQDGKPEANSSAYVYHEVSEGRWSLVDTITFLGEKGLPMRLEEFRKLNPDTVAEYNRVARLGDRRNYVHWLASHLEANPSELNRPGFISDFIPAAPDRTIAGNPVVVRQIPLPAVNSGRLQIGFTPSTRSKAGPHYFSPPFPATAPGGPAGTPVPVDSQIPDVPPDAPLPYGILKLRLRFSTKPTLEGDPILTTGIREAGDFIYVKYPDANHIRLGFDHWFKGGPLTAPIAIDYRQEHELVISMGSLFPAEESVAMADFSPEEFARLKHRVVVTLNGQTVMDIPADCYEAAASSVHVGRNPIKGTSSGPEFTGEILSIERIWPDIK